MTNVSLTAGQVSSNCKKELEAEVNKKSKNHLDFLVARKMIYQLLTCARIILVPTKVLKFTESELSSKLNITVAQLRGVQKSSTFYKNTNEINLRLVNLYCNTKLT
jgi:hypothetical protein